MTYTATTNSPNATLSVAARLAKALPRPACIELLGDLGAGKTAFVQGLAQGLGYSGEVTSPTFTISQIYELPAGRLYHFDFYRLQNDAAIAAELAEALADNQGVVAIEWGERSGVALPPDHLSVTLAPTANEKSRQMSIDGPAKILEQLS